MLDLTGWTSFALVLIWALGRLMHLIFMALGHAINNNQH